MQGFRPLFPLAPVALLAVLACGCDERLAAPEVVPASGTPALVVKAVPKLDALVPAFVGRMDKTLIRECSGLAAARKYPGVFWTFSDSGDTARLFAIRADGSVVKPDGVANYAGVKVSGAENHDWEAACVDESGRLLLGDIGNNTSSRKKLCLYVLPREPDPRREQVTLQARRVPFHYCDQTEIPDPRKNHDGEAMFSWRGDVYVLTKHWTDHRTELHRIDMAATEDGSRPTALVARLDVGGMVTDAALSPSGRRLAILTYTGLWVFDLTVVPGAHPLSGAAFFRPLVFPLTSWQVEAVAFSDESTLLIGNEEGDLFRVDFAELSPVH